VQVEAAGVMTAEPAPVSIGGPLPGIARSLGVFQLLRRVHRNDLLVLTVHGVVPPRGTLSWNPLRDQVDVRLFEAQINFLAKSLEFVDYQTALRILDGQVAIRNPVLLTFDDGYRNNLTYALPVLERRGIKPLLFLTTGYLDNARVFWFDRFDFAIQQIAAPWQCTIGARKFVFQPGQRDQNKTEYSMLRSFAKQYGWDDRKFHEAFSDWCEDLEALTGKSLRSIQRDDPWSSTVNPLEIRAAVERGAIDVGSHTIDHFRIDKLDAAERMRQLVESRRQIESLSGKPCRAFCYPNGDWNPAASRSVLEAGYESAFTTDAGFNNPQSDRFTLKRQFLPLVADARSMEALACGALLIKQRWNDVFSVRM
jgi:peptidoglycan/xylan/chitin deacetylase (PgdA/CDA1 family)